MSAFFLETSSIWGSAEEGNKAGEGSEAQALWGAAEWAEFVQSGEQEAQGRPHCTLQLPKGRLW